MKRSYKTQDGYFFYHQENGTLTDAEDNKDFDMSFDSEEQFFNLVIGEGRGTSEAIDVFTSNGFEVEITKDYEGDDYHVVSYEPSSTRPLDHYETVGFKTIKEVLTYLDKLEQEDFMEFKTSDIIFSGGYEVGKNKVFYTHKEIKDELSKDDLLLLLSEGFKDASYANDEAPSFYHPKSGTLLAIFVVKDEDDQSKPVTFEIYDDIEDEVYFSDDMADIIGIFKTIVEQRKKCTVVDQ